MTAKLATVDDRILARVEGGVASRDGNILQEVGGGPIIKRGIAVARGSWHPILKRTSHIRIVLSDEGRAKKVKSRPGSKPAKAEPKGAAESPTRPAEAKVEEQKAQ